MHASTSVFDQPSGAAIAQPQSTATARIGSIDAYRGLVMLLMMGEVLSLWRVARSLPQSRFWGFLAHHQTHSIWIGCSLHDLIQPSFSFLVGIALPFSLARRAREGQSSWRRTLHAFWRALILVLLGVFLRSVDQSQTSWTFEDTLSQIGLGYGFLYILAGKSPRVQWIALGVILFGYWLLFALCPLPGPNFDFQSVGVRPGSITQLTGFAAHWSMNTNAAWRFDTWFLNLFPRESKFTHNGGGYSTLSFIPTLGTMLLGVLAGGVMRSDRRPAIKLRWFVIAGLLLLGGGWLLGAIGICPVVKRIWTPSWVLFSGGWCFLFLATFYLIIDVANFRKWAFPLTVVGMNSIAAYLIAHLWEGFLRDALLRHIGPAFFNSAGKAYTPLLLGGSILLLEWLVLWAMYRKKIFLRV